jgi:hypothetical protein
MGYGNITVLSGTATLIVAHNVNRKSLIITNEGSSKVYLGGDSSVLSSTGISVEAESGKYTEDSGGQRMYLGDIYGISADSTNDVRYWEKE